MQRQTNPGIFFPVALLVPRADFVPRLSCPDRAGYGIIQVCRAEVAELADAPDSKSGGLNTRVGSTPTFGTRNEQQTRGEWRLASRGLLVLPTDDLPAVPGVPCHPGQARDQHGATLHPKTLSIWWARGTNRTCVPGAGCVRIRINQKGGLDRCTVFLLCHTPMTP